MQHRSAVLTAVFIPALLCLSSAPAVAQIPVTTVADGIRVLDGPVFAGEEVVWSSPGGSGSVIVRSAATGAEPRVLLKLNRPPRRNVTIEKLAGSAEAVAVSRGLETKPSCNGDSCSIGVFPQMPFAGPPSGPLFAVKADSPELPSGCSSEIGFFDELDLSRSLLINTELVTCGKEKFTRLVARDLDTGASAVLGETVTEVRSDIAAAPGVVAWAYRDLESDRSQIVVVDTSSGEVIYSLVSRVDRIDVQSDGTLVLLRPTIRDGLTTARAQVTWYSPSEPFAHEVGKTLDTANVAIADDEIVYSRHTGFRGNNSLVATDLAGNEVILRRFSDTRRLRDVGDLAFDGSTVAFAERRSSARKGDRVVALSVPE